MVESSAAQGVNIATAMESAIPHSTLQTPNGLQDGQLHFPRTSLSGDVSTLTIKQILAQLGGTFPMDLAVVEVLPPGSSFVSVRHFRTSAWTITGKVIALGPNGSEEYYFVKIAYGETGRIMLGGEYESSKIIYNTMPDFIPKPIGYGKYHAQGPATYFYLSQFVDMDVTAPPEPAEFTRRLAQLHKLSKSPTGKFGFAVQTCDGDRAHVVDWQESWAVFYRNLFLGVCDLDLKRNGPWPEYERAISQVAWKVIPRLLEPLQAKGRTLKPCIIHGNLWEGNMGISMETGDTLLFDAGSYFTHNEMELGHWRCEFSSVFRSEAYIRYYIQHYPPAEPAEEFEDRLRLYSLKGAINYSAGHPGSELRRTAYNNMCYLCEKYAPIDGIDKYDPLIDPLLTGACIVPHLADGLI
ncbi:Fructosamine kinase-domain-containing protein [Chaetomium sp. MPI-CAGE-AT-0009]|nr:Fructosamine kinase-domain-containing protein [Chaetomium sp. MPI-CAGE-AT-0009]